MSDKRIYNVVTSAVMLTRANTTYGPRMMNFWLPAEIWVEALQKMGHIDGGLAFNVGQFNAAFARSHKFGSVMSRFDGSNNTGIFRVSYQHRHYYYLTQESKQTTYPSPLNRAWKERVMETAANVLVIPSTRARPCTGDSIPVLATTTAGAVNIDVNEDEEQSSPSKRHRIHAPSNVGGSSSFTTSYWPYSLEAYHLFRPSSRSGGDTLLVGGDSRSITETPQEALERRILVLQSVNKREDSWRNVIIGRDVDNFCSKTEIFEIRQRASFLCRAYQLAQAHMNQWTWYKCCQEACNEINRLGMMQATSYKTVAAWNMTYRQGEGFAHPNPYVNCGKRPLPQLLEVFPDAKDQIVSYAIKNLAKLTIEAVHDFIVSKVIPRLITIWQSDISADDFTTIDTARTTVTGDDVVDNDDCVRLFLNAHRLDSLSLTTAWRWMRLLGFHYDTRKKSFYVDGHECEDVVANRNQFCREYLTEFEPYCRQWVQMTIEDASAIKDLDLRFGYHYEDIDAGTSNIEFHVDVWNRFVGTEAHQGLRQEATKSIRVSMQAKPIMIIGQDEMCLHNTSSARRHGSGQKVIGRSYPNLKERKGTCFQPSCHENWDLGER